MAKRHGLESLYPALKLRAGAMGLVFGAIVLAAVGTLRAPRPASAVDDPAVAAAVAPIPSGSGGDLIRYGRSLIVDTQKNAGQYITAGMSCAACHVNAGTKPHGGSFLGTYATFPQWNARAKRFITLGDRLDECFLYSMNGRPPAPYSREMVAMTAYIAWLSRGAEVGKGFPGQGFVTVHAPQPGDKQSGAKIFATQCVACHGADGAGIPAANIPPLWGPKSFNDGAGMNAKMPAFVKANMPVGREGSLSDQAAADVSAYVLSHERPHFDKTHEIDFPPEPAGFF
jgi:thiosulfate dehydrogenase